MPRPFRLVALLSITACAASPGDDAPPVEDPIVDAADDPEADRDRTTSASDEATPVPRVAAAISAADAVFVPPAGAKPGFPKDRTYVAGQILAANQLPCQGRVAAISYLNGWIYTSIETPSGPACKDDLERVWDISNPTAPKAYVALPPGQFGNPAFNAHAVLYKGPYASIGREVVADTYGGSIFWTHYTDHGLGDGGGHRAGLTPPWSVTNLWSYHDLDPVKIRKHGRVVSPASFDPLGETGIAGQAIILGNLMIYASDQSKRGIATYDLSDPAHPRQLDLLKLGIGSYWPEIYSHYVIFAGEQTLQVVDIADPTNLRFVAEIPTPDAGNAVYPHCQDEFCFYSTYKIDMRTIETTNPIVTRFGVSPTGQKLIDASHWQLPLGNLLVTGGNGGKIGGLSIVAHQAAPDTRGPFVAYHVPRGGQTHYPVDASISVVIHETLDMRTVNAQNIHLRIQGTTTDVPSQITFASNGLLTIVPDHDLAVGKTYVVQFAANGVRDVVGNPIDPYSFTFSTGNSVSGNAAPTISAFSANPAPAAPGSSVTLATSATDPNGPLQYRFDFGDGKSVPWGSAASASHAYAAAGHYYAKVQVRDALGAVSARSLGVTVTVPPLAAQPRQSGRFALAPSGVVFVINPDNATLIGLNRQTLAVAVPEQRIAANPRSIAVSASGQLWITSRGADRIEVRASSNGALVASIPLPYGAAPEGIVMTPDGRAAYVTLAGAGKLLRFDTTTRASTGVLALGPSPGALAITADGAKVLVARLVSPQTRGEVWSVTTGPVLTLSRTIGLLPSLGFDDDQLDPNGSPGNPDSHENARGVPNYLTAIAISPDGATAWVTAKKDNIYRGTFVDVAPNGEVRDLQPDQTVRSIVCVIDLATGAERINERHDLDNSEGPAALAFSPAGDYAFVALRGNNAVTVVDTLVKGTDPLLLGIHSARGRYSVGAAPRAVWVDPMTKRLWVYNDLSRSVTVLGLGNLIARGEPLSPVAGSPVTTSSAAFETLAPNVLAGKRLFYDAEGRAKDQDGAEVFRISSEGYIACASCHLDGGSDDRVWDFTGRGEGLRNTVSLRGRSGMGMGRVHWSGNFDEIQDFEGDIRKAFGGKGLMSDAAFAASAAPLGAPKAGRSVPLDQLASYVTSIGLDKLARSPYRNPDGSLTAQGVEGRAVFEANGCATCHGGPRFTESKSFGNPLRNVGTMTTASGRRLGGSLPGIDTPTLLGLWESAPYLHDGRAASLGDVFTMIGGAVLQGEKGTLAGGATRAYSRLAHGGFAVQLNSASSSVTFTAVDGGPAGGSGVITVRYGATNAGPFSITVNGKAYPATAIANAGFSAFRNGALVSVPVLLAAGKTNTVTIARGSMTRLDIDEVTVGSAVNVNLAKPHTRVPAADRADLIAYLLQLDRP